MKNWKLHLLALVTLSSSCYFGYRVGILHDKPEIMEETRMDWERWSTGSSGRAVYFSDLANPRPMEGVYHYIIFRYGTIAVPAELYNLEELRAIILLLDQEKGETSKKRLIWLKFGETLKL